MRLWHAWQELNVCVRGHCAACGFGFSLTLHQEAVDLQNKISLHKDMWHSNMKPWCTFLDHLNSVRVAMLINLFCLTDWLNRAAHLNTYVMRQHGLLHWTDWWKGPFYWLGCFVGSETFLLENKITEAFRCSRLDVIQCLSWSNASP